MKSLLLLHIQPSVKLHFVYSYMYHLNLSGPVTPSKYWLRLSTLSDPGRCLESIGRLLLLIWIVAGSTIKLEATMQLTKFVWSIVGTLTMHSRLCSSFAKISHWIDCPITPWNWLRAWTINFFHPRASKDGLPSGISMILKWC